MGSGPLPMLRGARVLLRPAERSDLATFTRWLNDARVTETLFPRGPMSLTAEERWFDALQEQLGQTRAHFVICLRADGQSVGVIGLDAIDWANGSAVLGIAIGEPHLWDQGLGTEATGVLLDHAFGELRLERVELDVYAFNERGRHSYEKAGFRLEGTRRRALYRHGRHHDVHVMAILRDEWDALDRRRTWELE